ncbi:TM2 domain-containing protein [Mucilaginibacter sp.]|uniref:TM2 domain-containing protein n=1 Tax=Mucilaginibacter sp. TaxID=1882438 RepID=UPI003D0A0AB0
MDMYQNPYMALPGITPEEMGFLQQGTTDLTDEQKKYFYMAYSSKRKSSQDILIFTLIGFFGVAGIQRFVLGEVVMGLLYLFTGGFCLIGTIVDLVNHKTLATDYNRKMAYESFQMAKMSVPSTKL